MKLLIITFSLFLIAFGQVISQNNDTVSMSSYQVADSIYRNLTNHIPSGYLLNRTLMDTNALAFNTDKLRDSIINADYFYGLMYEYKSMALDSSSIPSLINIFNQVNSYMGEHEFNEDIYIYPIGIADFNFEYFDEAVALQNNWINRQNAQFFENSQSHLAYESGKSQFVAPLFDMYSSDLMGITFREEEFFSNRHTVNDIAQLSVEHNGVITNLNFDEVYEFVPSNDAYQYFTFRVEFTDGDSIVNQTKIYTPELPIRERGASDSFEKCRYFSDKRGSFSDGDNNKIQYCLINACDNHSSGYRPKKPYILVTGYRPPIFFQRYKKTWKLYSNHHRSMLNHLKLNNYDIILVRFNIFWKPYQHGMLESADLFIEFLQDLNMKKAAFGGEYHENVIQGSSMGADIVRLALLKMEKKHFADNSYGHHRSRLFLSYDANYYGANLPLAYQYQIYSGFKYPRLVNTVPVVNGFLRAFLYASLEQKTVKQLLMYHAKANNSNLFNYPSNTIYSTPTHHAKRQNFCNELDLWDNHDHIFPLQTGTRNVAISLGKISGKNNDETNLNFKNAGDYWHDVNLVLWKRELRAGIYSTNYERLFRRKRISLLPFPNMTDHIVNVKQMQEIDNASGSYLKGLGNIIWLTDMSHLGLGWLSNLNEKFTHKSTLTALDINPNLWPSDGSHSLNMQSLGLMYNEFNYNPNQPSSYFGYPNLGRPTDHFEVTPFEAIYVGENIHPHIELKESDDADVDAINNFILNEVEPWYLGLQNDNLGEQARSNYTYKSLRRARFTITTGHLVTPKTDPGDYNVEPNADLKLQAGEQITLKPGTHVKQGAKAHLKIRYYECPPGSSDMSAGGNQYDENDSETNLMRKDLAKKEGKLKENQISIYPNPSRGSFTIASMQDVPIETLHVYNLNGTSIFQKTNLSTARFKFESKLAQGTYFAIINTRDGIIHRKKIIVL
ncbi:T9SS type A sorting domain-containing protein [Brumimicrobium oceani]|uniref:Secretion system C-terminal sorting domain-containing protein n=1 Tax=Brumimicrobium oceani TaxID=2100725 RepID=A0A2U2XAE2_9FLAO|nr:T9SS type A sorting domain-containing protein [Brumimicrobium oceani]PWH84764.1 hypothetical protein DIT68_12600 [Brumimicrobium oceani]